MPPSYKELSPSISWDLTNAIIPNRLFVLKSFWNFHLLFPSNFKEQCFFLLFKNWTIIASPCCVGCCAAKWTRAVYTRISSSLDLPPTPIPPRRPSQSRAELLCCRQLPTRHLLHTWWCIHVSANLPVRLTITFHLWVHVFLLYVCVSVPALYLHVSWGHPNK